MELFIDERRTDPEGPVTGTLEEILRQVQSGLVTPGRLLVSVRCDGEAIPANDMAATLKRPISSFERLEVFTSTPGELVADTMEQATVSLTQTEAACQQVADYLAEGNTAAGMEALGQCMTVWQQIHDAVGKSIRLLQVDPEQMEVNAERLIDIIARPKEVLLQIKEALESQDHVLLADTLKYEFSDVARQWHAVIGRIRQEAEDLAAPAGEAI